MKDDKLEKDRGEEDDADESDLQPQHQLGQLGPKEDTSKREKGVGPHLAGSPQVLAT